MQIIEHRYDNKPARFYIDGVRVSKNKMEYIKDTRTLSCMQTKCTFDNAGNCHRINYIQAN